LKNSLLKFSRVIFFPKRFKLSILIIIIIFCLHRKQKALKLLTGKKNNAFKHKKQPQETYVRCNVAVAYDDDKI
jgi:hypothetical protein